MTGDSFARLLEEIENERSTSSPYRVDSEKIQEKRKKVDGELESLMDRIQRLWAFEFPVYIKTYQGKSTTYNF